MIVSCLLQRMLHDSVITLDMICKNMGEENTRANELALEGHRLFISCQKYNYFLSEIQF